MPSPLSVEVSTPGWHYILIQEQSLLSEDSACIVLSSLS